MSDYSNEGLIVWDYIAVGVYFLLNLCVGVYALCKPNRGSINGYFLANRFMWWLPVGASLFASNIGSEHFIGMAGSGAAGGIGVGAFNFNSIILLQFLGWIFVPVFLASGVRTAPEYMAKRFGGERIQMYLVVLSLSLYIFTKISVDLYSGALFINQAFHWNIYSSIFGLLVLTAICTMTGGLAAVIYTDTLQLGIMILGAMVVMIKAFEEVGGYEALQYKYMQATPKLTYENSTCGVPRKDSWIMLRDPVNSDLPWPAFILGQTPASIWYWCADQVMVQRVLSVKSLSHAQGATLFAAYIKILPFFMIILPGMISRVLFPNDVACVLPEECLRACGSTVSCYNSAYPRLVVGIMPPGLKGLMLAVILAALMSDLTSIFNSASTMFTIDIWKRVRPTAKTKELLIVGKLSVLVLVGISVAWVPIIEKLQGGQLFIYIQKIGAYLSPPIACVYLLAVLWPRMNEQGAFWSLMTGFFVGVVRMVLDFLFLPPACNEVDTRPLILSRVNFMYFAALLFWLTGFCGIIVSLMTDPPSSDKLIRTTYTTRLDQGGGRPDENYSLTNTDSSNKSNFEETSLPQNERKQSTSPADDEDHHRASIITKPDSEESIPDWRRFVSIRWLCGLDVTSNEEGELEMNRKRALSSLNQNKWAKLFLNTNLVVVISIAIALFAYYSVDPFSK